MRIVIAGAGSVGRYMAEQLASFGHEVTLIDSRADALTPQRIPMGIQTILGDACEIDVLDAAGASNADVMASVTGDDEDNLVISLLAKQEFGIPRVVGRVNNPRNEWMFTDMWGVDVSVSTPHLLTALVEEAVTVGALIRILSFEQGRTQLSEVTLAPSSPAIGRTIGGLGLPREDMIVAVVRDGHVVRPTDDLTLQDGDEVLVLIGVDGEASVRTALIGL